MRKNLCAAMAQKEIIQGLLFGVPSLAVGLLIIYADGIFSGPFLTMLENLGRNLVTLCVSLFLIIGGAYLLFHGLQGLFRLENTDICGFIKPQLHPDEEHLTGKEMLALVDQDLAYALDFFSNGRVLIGQEWLFVPQSMGQSVIRLENICKISRRGTNSTGFYLKFGNQHGRGPSTGELTPTEADAIETYLQNVIPEIEVIETPQTF